MLARGLAGIPEPARAAARAADRLRTRADAGYFTADLAKAAVEQGCDFAIAAKRNTAMWRAYASIEPDAWTEAIGMPGAQVAAADYAPAGWPEGTYTIVRRVRVDAEDISADPRSRRRRTIDKNQLALALEGTATHAHAVSFIVTNIPANDRPGQHAADAETILEVEAWFRRRTDIEDRIREAKLGAAWAAALRPPSGQQRVDVGRADRGEPLGPAPGTDRDRPRRPRPRRQTPSRTALRPSPPDPPRPAPDPAATTR